MVKLLRRSESTQNVSFAVLVAAYVVVCAAVPSIYFGAGLAARDSLNGRRPTISIAGSLRAGSIKFRKQSRPDPGAAPFAMVASTASVPTEFDSNHSQISPNPDAILMARLGTGALTARFLAAS